MKSRKVTRLFAILSAVALGLTACGNDGAQPGGENSQPSSTGQKEENQSQGGGESKEESPDKTERDLSEQMHVSIFSQADDVGYEEFIANPVFEYWAKMFNLELEWQLPPQGSETDQLNMMFGTQDYTVL